MTGIMIERLATAETGDVIFDVVAERARIDGTRDILPETATREELVRIAALAIARAEEIDRKHKADVLDGRADLRAQSSERALAKLRAVLAVDRGAYAQRGPR